MNAENMEPRDTPAGGKKSKKFAWYWAPVYCAIWFVLFYVVVIPCFFHYPAMLRIEDEHEHPEEFIGERSRNQLSALESIGVKLAGTVENEVYALNYLLGEIEKVKAAARLDLYDIDVRVQRASGQFRLWAMSSSYRNITNIIVKLAPKNSTSLSYLLLNSHYDSEIGSPAAADAGVMIVTMLETLRVISRSAQVPKNPIVFLLNGGEESGLLASHAFITQHEWAPFCKALINLDSAGSGGREVVFQSGPEHPWLLKYYKQSVPHPFVSALAEELFQRDFVPSDTDFRIFRDYGALPGLDMAHFYNGYVYHTKYDNLVNLERGTYQSTGENVLALTRALANAAELGTNGTHTKGHAVFNDFLGIFTILYSERTGIVINVVTSLGAFIAIAISLYRMTEQAKTIETSKRDNYLRFFVILAVQVLTLVAAAGVTILMALIIDSLSLSLSWYWAEWISFGLYYCPMFFVMGFLPALYITWTRKTTMTLDNTISCFMHAHCLLLAIACLLLTSLGFRAAYFVMIAVFFYTVSVVLSLLAHLFCKISCSLPIHLLCQLIPFWFYTYQTFTFMQVFVPMQGRDGPTNKPDLLIAAFAIVMAIQFAGFILPILHKFRKSKSLFSLFGVLAIIFVIIAATPAGFPFRSEVAVQRFYTLHTNRIIHDEFGQVRKNDSGFYIQTVDPRDHILGDTVFKNALPSKWLEDECTQEIFCGLPLYNTRWMDWKNYSLWIPANPPHYEIPTTLTLLSKQQLNQTHIRFNFTLHSTDRVVVFIDPLDNNKVIDWSFEQSVLVESNKPPYFVHHVDSMVEAPLDFWLVVEGTPTNGYGQFMRLAVGAHFQHHTPMYTEEFNNFLQSFPTWAYATTSVSFFESWYF